MKKYLKLFYLIGALAGASPAYGWFGITKDTEPRYHEAQIAEMRAEHNYKGLVSTEQDQEPDLLYSVIQIMADTHAGEELLNNLIKNNAVILTHLFQESAPKTRGQTDGEQIGMDIKHLTGISDTLWVLTHESEHVHHINNAKANGIDSIKGQYNNFVSLTIREALAERKAAQVSVEYLQKQPTDHPRRQIFENICSNNRIRLAEYPDFVFRQRMNCGQYTNYLPNYNVYEGQSLVNASDDKGIKNPDWDKIISIMSDGEITELKYFPIPKNSALKADMMSLQTNSIRENMTILLEKYRPETVEIVSQKENGFEIQKFMIIGSDNEDLDTYLEGYRYGKTEISLRETLDFTLHYAQGKLKHCQDSKERKQILSDLRLISSYQKEIGENAEYRTDCRKRDQERTLSKLIDGIYASGKTGQLKLHMTFDPDMNISGFKSPLISQGSLSITETADWIIEELTQDITMGKENNQELMAKRDLLRNLKDAYTAKPQSLLNILAQELKSSTDKGYDIKTNLSDHGAFGTDKPVKTGIPFNIKQPTGNST